MRKYLLASAAALGLVAGVSGSAYAQSAKPPAPGTLVVHFHGRLNDQVNMIGTTGDSVDGANKLNPIGMSGFIRLYPGFDAQTESGIQYGASIELRTGYTTAGTGVKSGNAPYIRRAYGYLGTPEAGFIRFGQTDGIWWLLSTGEYYNFGDGNLWNSDGGVGAAVPVSGHPAGLFTSSGVLYTTNKIVYISPTIAGFKAGFDYEPNSNGFKEGEACNIGIDCATLASTPGGAGPARRKNTITGGLEYSGMFSGMGVKAAVDYLHAAPIGNSDGTPILTITAPGGAVTNVTGYKPMDVMEISGEVKYAGFTLGVNAKHGQVNNGYTFLLPGQRQLSFIEVTGIYDFGPYTVGGYYFSNQAAGRHTAASAPTVGQMETDYGIALGANYALAKHLGLYATYLYGSKHQAGVDFVNNEPGMQDTTQSQAFSLGAVMNW